MKHITFECDWCGATAPPNPGAPRGAEGEVAWPAGWNDTAEMPGVMLCNECLSAIYTVVFACDEHEPPNARRYGAPYGDTKRVCEWCEKKATRAFLAPAEAVNDLRLDAPHINCGRKPPLR